MNGSWETADAAKLREEEKQMGGWKSAGAVADGEPIRIGELNVWDHDWTRLQEPELELPHPSYPSQLHTMTIYEIRAGGKAIRFAAGELSANVWGFYVPE
jgi:hypothetical protein